VTVDASFTWRDPCYTRSLVAHNAVRDTGLNRRFFTAQAQILGPIVNRVFDTPNSGYAEKFKHSIEPFLTLQRTSSIDNVDRIVYIQGIDRIIGGTTQYAYGVNNRI